MTRVGIMSMQRILNYGSTLQAYALRRLLERADGSADVGFLDYRPGPPLVANVERTSRLARTVSKLRAYGGIDVSLSDKLRFMNHKRTYATKYLPTLGIDDRASTDTPLDLQVIGSDEVFNCVQTNARVGYSRDLFGYDTSARRLISYAASFGNTTLEKIECAGIRGDLEEAFARFDALSVRDRNSADIIESITGTRPLIHIDPVLAYDYLAAEPRIPQRRRKGPYVVVYGYPGRISRHEGAAIERYARRVGADVVSIGGIQDGGGRFVDCDPFEVLAYIRDAQSVITDTFHGTIFSLINGTPFATIVRHTVGEGYGNQEKLGYLLESFGLQARQVFDLVELETILETPLDVTAIRAVLDRERLRTTMYLDQNTPTEGAVR